MTMTVADVLYAVAGLDPAAVLGSPAAVRAADGLYLVSWFLLGGAGLHHSMTALSMPYAQRWAPVRGTRFAALAVASLAGPLALLVEAARMRQGACTWPRQAVGCSPCWCSPASPGWWPPASGSRTSGAGCWSG